MNPLKLTLVIFMISLISNLSFAWASNPVVRLDGEQLTLNVKDELLSTILEKLSNIMKYIVRLINENESAITVKSSELR